MLPLMMKRRRISPAVGLDEAVVAHRQGGGEDSGRRPIVSGVGKIVGCHASAGTDGKAPQGDIRHLPLTLAWNEPAMRLLADYDWYFRARQQCEAPRDWMVSQAACFARSTLEAHAASIRG
jgi:hypothetical protein